VVLYIFIILDYRIKMLQDTIHMKSGLCCDLDQLTRIIKAYDLSYFFFLFSQQIIHVVLQCLNYDVQFLILFGYIMIAPTKVSSVMLSNSFIVSKVLPLCIMQNLL
jgi:hypothetical protein